MKVTLTSRCRIQFNNWDCALTFVLFCVHRFGQVNRPSSTCHNVRCTAYLSSASVLSGCRRNQDISAALSDAAAAARWNFLPTTTTNCRSHRSVSNGRYLLCAHRTSTAAAAASATVRRSSSTGRGRGPTSSVVRSTHRPVMCRPVVLCLALWSRCIHLGQ